MVMSPGKLFFRYLIIIIFIFLLSGSIFAEGTENANDYFDLSIEELLNIDVSVASKKSESLSDAPGIITAIPHEEIEIYGDRNLSQLMQRQPSVYTLFSPSYGNSIASFRGDMPTHQEKHTLILINGRPVRETAIGYNYPIYMALPVQSLERAELIRGPGSVLYGTNAFTGVIDLKTRTIPDNNEISVSFLGGSYGYHDTTLSLGGREGELAYTIDARTSGQDGWPYSYTDTLGTYDNRKTENDMYSVMSHLDYRDFTFDIFATKIDVFNLGTNWTYPYHNNVVKRLFTNLGYRYEINDRTSFEINTTLNLQEDTLSTGTHLVGTNSYEILGEATLYTSPLDNMNILLGILQEYRRNYKPSDDTFQSIPSYDYEPMSIYAQGDYKIGDFVKLTAGTQWNKSQLGDSDFVNRYGIIFTPDKNWGVKLLRGEAFRGPTTLESDLYDDTGSFVFAGNKDLEPEKITTYDAQLFYNNKKTNAAITFFHSKSENSIIYDYTPTEITYKNGGEQKFNGIEFEAKHFFTTQWHILGSYMHQNEVADDDLSESQTPSDMSKLGIGYTWDGGSASLFNTFYSAPKVMGTLYNPKSESNNLLSMNVRFDISKWLNVPKKRAILTLKGENLLNDKVYIPIISSDTYPYGPGMTFYAGLQMKF